MASIGYKKITSLDDLKACNCGDTILFVPNGNIPAPWEDRAVFYKWSNDMLFCLSRKKRSDTIYGITLPKKDLWPEKDGRLRINALVSISNTEIVKEDPDYEVYDAIFNQRT